MMTIPKKKKKTSLLNQSNSYSSNLFRIRVKELNLRLKSSYYSQRKSIDRMPHCKFECKRDKQTFAIFSYAVWQNGMCSSVHSVLLNG